MKPFLFIALDGLAKKEKETLEIAKNLSRLKGYDNFGFKVNLDYLLFGQGGMVNNIIRIIQLGRPIFTDFKMWNGHRIMSSLIDKIVELGVDYITVHALADKLITKSINSTIGTNTKVLGLTVLTHFNDEYCRKHFRRSLLESINHFTQVAVDAGCHGVVLPAIALDVIADINTIKVTPGIRPKGFKDRIHKNAVEPAYAKKKGADILVCGTPIMKSPDPVKVLENILSEIK